jgi:hypothetical protein
MAAPGAEEHTNRAVAAIIGNTDGHPGHATPSPRVQAHFSDFSQAHMWENPPGS